jgi:hypothetical protein
VLQGVGSSYSEDDEMSFSGLHEHTRKNRLDAERYRKLRAWMTSNVKEGWDEVTTLAAVGCHVDWDAFDHTLDQLPECNVGLCEVSK